MASKSDSGRHLRLEEYASSGLVMDSNDLEKSLSRVKVRSVHSSERRNVLHNDDRGARIAHSASSSHRQNDHYMEAFGTAHEKHSGVDRAHTGKVKPKIDKKMLEPSSTGETMTQIAVKQMSSSSTDAWMQGPRTPEGKVFAVSDRPLMCMSMSADESEVVVGSSDHALYALPVVSSRGTSGSRPRTLYTKRYGHTEWVTCVMHLPDRRIVSGGMDSKLCLWDATGVKCEDLLGHSGSVSCVLGLNDEIVVSAGYDKMLRLWNVGRRVSSRQREVGAVKAGTAPIMDVCLLSEGQQAVCGDRDGGLQVVDLQANKVLRVYANAHRGHTTSVLRSQDEDSAGRCFVSGGQDGVVNVWDSRVKKAVFSLELHVDTRSGKTGAVGFLREPKEDSSVLITGGADGVINVLDKRQSYGVVHSFKEHSDFIYSMHVRGQLCFSGAGNGMLHVHDWKKGNLLYGLGANQAAVRAIEVSASHLIAAGDDGGVIMYQ